MFVGIVFWLPLDDELVEDVLPHAASTKIVNRLTSSEKRKLLFTLKTSFLIL